MKTQLKYLISLCLVFLIVVFIVDQTQKDNDSTEVSERKIFSFVPEDVVSFDINNFTLGLRFELLDEKWSVRRFKNQLALDIETKEGKAAAEEDAQSVAADPVQITRLLEKIIPAKIGLPISSNPESASQLQILPQALHVIFYGKDKKELGRLHIGKQGPDLYSSFVKKPDDHSIYLVQENLRGLVLLPYEDWLLAKPAKDDPSKTKIKNKKK